MNDFYSRPCERGDNPAPCPRRWPYRYFYSRPCERGDSTSGTVPASWNRFLLTPLREGRQSRFPGKRRGSPYFYSRPCERGDRCPKGVSSYSAKFLLTPLREGRLIQIATLKPVAYFYSRPCERGDRMPLMTSTAVTSFLLTPLREGRQYSNKSIIMPDGFLLTPLREGRLYQTHTPFHQKSDFYSRPCERGDGNFPQICHEALRQIAEK